MPSQFETQFALQLPALYAEFGFPGSSYTGPDNTIVNGLTVRRHLNEVRQLERQNGVSGEMQTAEIFVLRTDLAKPVKGGRFTIVAVNGPETWTIETTPIAENGEFICTCTRSSTERIMERRARE